MPLKCQPYTRWRSRWRRTRWPGDQVLSQHPPRAPQGWLLHSGHQGLRGTRPKVRASPAPPAPRGQSSPPSRNLSGGVASAGMGWGSRTLGESRSILGAPTPSGAEPSNPCLTDVVQSQICVGLFTNPWTAAGELPCPSLSPGLLKFCSDISQIIHLNNYCCSKGYRGPPVRDSEGRGRS